MKNYDIFLDTIVKCIIIRYKYTTDVIVKFF